MVVVVLIGASGLWWLNHALFAIDFTPMPFVSEVWKSSPSPDTWDSPRLRMVDDLLAKGLLSSADQAAVASLLGPADETNYFKADNRWVYHLGRERSSMAIDCEWLLIDFGQDGRVATARLARD